MLLLFFVNLSEEVHVSLANGRVFGLSNFGIIVVDPLAILLNVTHVVTTMCASTQVCNEAIQIVVARSTIAILTGFLGYIDISHFMITVWVITMTKQPLCCSIRVHILYNIYYNIKCFILTQLFNAFLTFFSEKPKAINPSNIS